VVERVREVPDALEQLSRIRASISKTLSLSTRGEERIVAKTGGLVVLCPRYVEHPRELVRGVVEWTGAWCTGRLKRLARNTSKLGKAVNLVALPASAEPQTGSDFTGIVGSRDRNGEGVVKTGERPGPLTR